MCSWLSAYWFPVQCIEHRDKHHMLPTMHGTPALGRSFLPKEQWFWRHEIKPQIQWYWLHMWPLPSLGVLLDLDLHAYLKYTTGSLVTEDDWSGSTCLKYFLSDSPFSTHLRIRGFVQTAFKWKGVSCERISLKKFLISIAPVKPANFSLLDFPLQMCSRSVSQEPSLNKNELPLTWVFYMCSKKSNETRVTVYL